MTERTSPPPALTGLPTSTHLLNLFFQQNMAEAEWALRRARTEEQRLAVGRRMSHTLEHIVALTPEYEPQFRRAVYEYAARAGEHFGVSLLEDEPDG